METSVTDTIGVAPRNIQAMTISSTPDVYKRQICLCNIKSTMQSLHGNCLIAYARHKYILTMVNGEYRYFNGGDLVFADASQIRVDKCVENFVLVSRDTLSLFLPMLKEEALNLHAHKKISSLLVHHCSRDIPVFQEVAQLSQNKNLRYAEMLRKRALIFALLSVFLEDEHFIPLLLNVLQPNMRTRVCTCLLYTSRCV